MHVYASQDSVSPSLSVVASQVEAASTRGLPTEAEIPTFSFKPQLHQDLRARDTRNEAVTKCYLVKFSSNRLSGSVTGGPVTPGIWFTRLLG